MNPEPSVVPLSVVIPVYGSGAWLEELVAAVGAALMAAEAFRQQGGRPKSR